MDTRLRGYDEFTGLAKVLEVIVSDNGYIILDGLYRRAWRHSMDFVYLATLLLFFTLIAGLALGCANLGGIK